jgi:MerR family transcriptional regulator/heat shock protein HspR
MNSRPNRTADPPVGARGGADAGIGPGPAAPPAGPPRPAHDDTTPVYVISIAAQLAGMHPQTLRSYDRLGLVTPGRSQGRGRRYSARDVALLREVQRLSQEEGINLEGIRRILELEAHVATLRAKIRELADELERTHDEADRRVAEAHQSHRRDLVPVDRSAVVIWRPGRR